MTSRRFFLLGSASAVCASAALGKVPALHPPVARVAPVSDVYWGQNVIDPYRWMETKPETAEWTNWLKAQADYARQALDPVAGAGQAEKALGTYAADTTDVFVTQVSAGHSIICAAPRASRSSASMSRRWIHLANLSGMASC